LARKPTHISILQLDSPISSWLRIATDRERIEVLAYETVVGTEGEGPESVIERLAAFTAEREIGADVVYSILPRHQLTTRILTLPSQDKGEIATMIGLSAEEYVPFSANEIVVDQVILQKLPTGEARVLVAIAHQDVVTQHVALLKAAGLEPQHIYLSTTCLAAAVMAAASASPEPRFAIVHLAAGGLEVLVFSEGKLEFCRGVASAVDWTDPAVRDQAIEELALEVRGSLATYRRESEDGEAVDVVYLCSDIADPEPFVEPLFTETGKQVEKAPFLGPLVPAGREKLGGAVPLAAAGAAHTALKGSHLAIDLVPADLSRGRAEAHIRQRVFKVVAAVGVVVLALAVLYGQLTMQRKGYIQELRQQIGAIEDTARGIEEKERQLRILREQVERTGSLLEILATAASAAPEKDLNVTKIGFGRVDGLDIWGIAKTRDHVAGYAQELRDRGGQTLQFFRHARSLYESQGSERGEPIFHYHITVPMMATDEEGGDNEPLY